MRGPEATDDGRRPGVYRLRAFRGIDTLTAFGLCAEIGDFARFAKPAQLSVCLGIVPAEYTTDSKRRLGSIPKAGSSHARRRSWGSPSPRISG